MALLLAYVGEPGSGQPPSLMGTIGAGALHQLGRWDEAARLLGDARLAAETGGLTAVARTLVSGALAVDRGDHEQARDELEVARTWCHQVADGRLNGVLHRSLAELAVWQGRYDDARREVDTGLDLLAHTGDPELAARIAAVGVRVEADLAETIRRSGGRPAGRTPLLGRRGAGDDGPEARGRRLVAELERLAATTVLRHAPPSSEARASLLTGQAELSRVTGRSDAGRWQEAAATWDAIGFPYCAAYARFRRAEAALTAGDAPTAHTELTAAWGAAQRLGAVPLAGAVERLGRPPRIDLGAPAGPAATLADGGPPLTPPANPRSWRSWPRVAPTARSARRCSSATRPPASTSPGCWPSSAPATGPRPPPRPAAWDSSPTEGGPRRI